MIIKHITNNIFNSNSYILYTVEDNNIWIIDPGSNTFELINWIEANKKNISGILLTHTHFDHIYGLNELCEKFPNISIYASEYAGEGMKSEKLNGSLYMEIPFTVSLHNYIIIKEHDKVYLWENIFLEVIETPGHDRDCISFIVDDYIFSGDALIPSEKVYTKLKYSNKLLATESINKIFTKANKHSKLMPGHGEVSILFSEIKIEDSL